LRPGRSDALPSGHWHERAGLALPAAYTARHAVCRFRGDGTAPSHFAEDTMATISTRRFLQTAGLLLAGFALAACGKKEPAPAVAPAAAPATAAASAPPPPAKVYAVGTDAAYAPFESQNEKGEIVGLTVDVVNAVAKKAGIEVKFVNTPWEGIFNSLQQGDRDMLASSITITDERKQSMDFTNPYFDAYQLIAVKATSKVAKFDDLKKLKVGVQTGTTGDEAVTKLQGKNSTNIKRFESTPLALKELEAGGVEAVVADNGVVINYVTNNPGAKFRTVSDKSFAPEQYGFAVKKGNTELLDKLNKGLADIKADGSYAQIYAKYFGTAPASAATAATPAASK
jgi:polar amino acid transport system substrate-binding protein